ncbi:MAG: CotH kinase family protein [Firmicutes bacterium]|nr:CotH kinase family protein [Bacillota bacterium]
MITSKHIDKIIILLMAAAVIVCLVFMIVGQEKAKDTAPGQDERGVATEYEQKLFDPDHLMSVDIIMDQDKWNEMLDTAMEKKWQNCDVIVNGTRFYNVGIRPKGDSSLSSIAESPDCNRYSFKLKFDKYTDGQKCWGLDKLCLNNNYGDITNMKEAMVYDMFRYLDADAPLWNYAKISLNGEYWGVYLALEAVDDSFLRRNYGTQHGALYKPGSSAAGDEELEEDWPEEDMGLAEDADMMWEDFAEDDMFEEGIEEGGAELKYIDDDPESYWGIFPCQISKTTDEDHRRVIAALKNISEKKRMDSNIDTDNVLRYMVAHQFSVNNDSLSGDGAHNYYLYETDSRLNLIPWDYNLCFGAYEMESWDLNGAVSMDTTETASNMINHPIDDFWMRTSFFDGLLQAKEYRELYHRNFRSLIEGYVLGGGFDLFYNRTRAQIDDLVKNDPNALYSYGAYDKAAKMLQQAVKLRGKSIKGQLDGSIPSTKEEQQKHPELLIDAGRIDLSVMGGDSLEEDMENGSETDEAEWDEMSEEDWESMMNEWVQQQNVSKKKAIRQNALMYALYLTALLAALAAALAYHRRRM